MAIFNGTATKSGGKWRGGKERKGKERIGKERKRKETPFGVILMRSQVLYRAAQAPCLEQVTFLTSFQQLQPTTRLWDLTSFQHLQTANLSCSAAR